MKPNPRYGWHGIINEQSTLSFVVGARVRRKPDDGHRGILVEDVTGTEHWRNDVTVWLLQWDYNPLGHLVVAIEPSLEVVDETPT